MNALEYYELFDGKCEQIGRLFFLPQKSARATQFKIFVIGEGVTVDVSPYGEGNVEVYGIVSGVNTSRMKHGWLHEGKWQDDVADICEAKMEKKAKDEIDRLAAEEIETEKEEQRKKLEIENLLSDY